MTRRVLIVDDNADLAEDIGELLELEGFEVTVLTSPTETLAKSAELEFDAALLDIRMPGLDGIELCARLGESHPNATFVLMTAFTSEERLAEAEGSGARAVLRKPLPFDQLLSLLSAMDAGQDVLIVDDDDALRESLADLLSPHGYTVRTAASLAEARAHVDAARPDAALIDLRLPDGSGAELGRELIAQGVAVVVTTGYDEPAIVESVSALRSRGARYLEKPFPAAALLELLSDARARPGQLP